MKKFIMYVGLNDGIKNKQLIKTKKAIKKVVEIINNKSSFSCFSLSLLNGCWYWTIENTIKIEINASDNDLKDIINLCSILKKEFNQKSIMLEKYNDININFI